MVNAAVFPISRCRQRNARRAPNLSTAFSLTPEIRVISATFAIFDVIQAWETRCAVIAVWMAKALASHRQPSSQL